MANFVHTNHDGIVWQNAGRVNRHSGPTADPNTVIDTVNAGQSVIVLCYSHGDTESHTTPGGVSNTSDAWDFVVTSDQDPGGFVADVFLNTGGDIVQQLGPQGVCGALQQRLAEGQPPAQG
jgi:hypothetical protein